MPDTMRYIGRSLFYLWKASRTSHDIRGAPAFLLPLLSHDDIEEVLSEALKESGIEKVVGSWIRRDVTLKAFVTTLRNHFDNIITFIERPLTNAVGEGINRLLKIVKNRASGFRGLEPFADLIFLTVGDLDIPAQIPSDLRTL